MKNMIISISVGLIVLFTVAGTARYTKQKVLSERKAKKEVTVKILDKKPLAVKKESTIIIPDAVPIAVTPDTFPSYIVSVRIDLNEPALKEKAISDIKKACSLIGTSPTVTKADIVGIQGLTKNKENGTEKVFKLEMEE